MTVRPRPASTDTGRAGHRLEFLDALRGIAVALVLAQHVGERLWPGFAEFTHEHLQLGQLGVMVFFLCSGFIIPASLERGDDGSTRRRRFLTFWRGRFFRLFPLYWLSLAAAGWLAFEGVYTPPTPMTTGDWVLNLSMVQMAVGAPNAIVVYWTLFFELLFYAGLSVLFLLGLHRHSVALSVAASVGCLALALGAGSLVGIGAPTGAFCLATMLTGTVFHRWHSGSVRLRTLVGCVLAAVVAGGALAHTAVAAAPPENPRFPAMLAAWIGAYAIVCTGMLLRSRPVPAALRRLGTISYSVYLLQAVVLVAVPELASRSLTALMWVAVVVAASEASYRLVETPAIRLARRSGSATRPQVGGAGARAGVPAPRRPAESPTVAV